MSKKPTIHAQMCKCVSKITAYVAVGNKESAKIWANNLVVLMRQLGLVD